MQITTSRVRLRQWKTTDLPSFALLNADVDVMEFFPKPLSTAQSDDLADRLQSFIRDNGWGFWAAELNSSGEFIGFVGLNSPVARLPFSPCIEIGWRLHKRFWKHGYATEAAIACLRYAFENLPTDEVVSFTPQSHQRSRAVMERLGLQNTQQNFLHPSFSKNDPRAECALYKINRHQWQTLQDPTGRQQ